jgi:hypothetical protein
MHTRNCNINGRSALPLGLALAMIPSNAASALVAFQKGGPTQSSAKANLAVSATTVASVNLTFTTDARGFTLASNGTSEGAMDLGSVQSYGAPVPTNATTTPTPVHSTLQQNADSAHTRTRTISPWAPVQTQTAGQVNPAGTESSMMAEGSPSLISYSVSLYSDSRTEVGKPASFHAELHPSPSSGKPLRYCFSWGDGSPESCQDSPEAAHIYRSRGKYSATVAVIADQDRRAAGIPIQIEAFSPVWLKTLLPLSSVLLLLVAAYGTHKARRMLKGAVLVKIDLGHYSISSAVVESDAGFHIRCVRSPVVSKLAFSSYDRLI